MSAPLSGLSLFLIVSESYLETDFFVFLTHTKLKKQQTSFNRCCKNFANVKKKDYSDDCETHWRSVLVGLRK